MLIDPNPWSVNKEGVSCGRIVSTPSLDAETLLVATYI